MPAVRILCPSRQELRCPPGQNRCGITHRSAQTDRSPAIYRWGVVTFVTQVLKPHLQAYNVWAHSVLLLPGQGGVVSWEKLRSAIKADVGRLKHNQYVTTMIDLYAIGNYPGAERRFGETSHDRIKRIEQNMAEGLPNPRFLPYIQVHKEECSLLTEKRCLTVK